MTTVQQLLTRLESQQAQAAQLRKELSVSLAIQAFMPDAFAFGPCSIGAVSPNYRPTPKNSTVRFTLGNGEMREFPASQVPEEIWPASFAEAINLERRTIRHGGIVLVKNQRALAQERREAFMRNLP